jgi:hypothetical protein
MVRTSRSYSVWFGCLSNSTLETGQNARPTLSSKDDVHKQVEIILCEILVGLMRLLLRHNVATDGCGTSMDEK